ncbi:tripartite motif-containing protein 75-like [Brachyhypopomus gauderio]|uniref:tripartite motif-containing protein 75-like n=1 Tax=Brachyhypopomus gauderio TaxID=698409 RepID=UPI004041D50B
MAVMADDLEKQLKCTQYPGSCNDPLQQNCGHFCHKCSCKIWANQADYQQSYLCPECRRVSENYPASQRNIKMSNMTEQCQQVNKELQTKSDNILNVHLTLRNGTADSKHTQTRQEGCVCHDKFFYKDYRACVCNSCWEEHKTHRCQLLEEDGTASKDVLKVNIKRLEETQHQMQTMVGWLQSARSQLEGDHTKLRKKVAEMFEEIQEVLCAERDAVLALIDNEQQTRLKNLESHIVELERKKKATEQLITASLVLVERDVPMKESMDHFDLILQMLMGDVSVPPCCVERPELDGATVAQLKRDGQVAVRNVTRMVCHKLQQRRSVLMKPPWTPTSKPSIRVALNPSPVPEETGLTLDPNTAHCNIRVSDDRLSAWWVAQPDTRPAHPERFRLHPQVICSRGLWRGDHAWGVEVRGTRRWEVGVTCKSRDKSWVDSCINWALRWDGQLQAFEGLNRHFSPKLRSIKEAPTFIRVHLDCVQKTLSFSCAEEVEQAESFLHSFSIKASGPLFPGFYLEESCVKIKTQTNSRKHTCR